MPRGAKPGERRGGRAPGVPNKNNRELKALAGRYDEEAVKTLVAIFQSAEAPPQARVAAIRELWDRAHGRPSQAVAVDAGPSLQKLLVGWIGEYNDSHV